MSEFNANPSSSEDFLKSFLQRTASELDNLAQLGSKWTGVGGASSRRGNDGRAVRHLLYCDGDISNLHDE